MTHIEAKFQSNIARRRTSTKPVKPPPTPRVPHVAKLMALAIRLEHLLATRQVNDQAEIARTAGITRARVTQILNLTNLAPDIQQALLDLEPSTDPAPQFRERDLREIAIQPNWIKQRKAWESLVASQT
jgi:hypothetical protein